MAELVQQTLDRMVVPLRDLMDRGIFSEVSARQEGAALACVFSTSNQG